MADTPLTYWDFAENDRTFFREAYNNGIKGSALASLGKGICVRYLKHMASEYGGDCTGTEQNARENALRTHNLQALVRYIQGNMGTAIPQEVEDSLDRVNGFGMQTVCPGPDSFLPSGKDIDKANAAVELTRCFVLEACGKKKGGEGMIIPRASMPASLPAATAGIRAGKTSSYTVRQRKDAIRRLRKQEKEYERKYGDSGHYTKEMEELFREISRSWG